MRITETKINGIQNPMGFIYDFMLCSWKVEDTESKKQVHAKIEVSEDADFTRILWEKEGEDLKQSGEKIDLELKPRTTYYYRVTVTGDQGDTAVSDFAYFETGKMQEAWEADWIAPQKEDAFHPVIGTKFVAAKPVKRARLYASGVGVFEAYLNGKKLGEEFLAPYVNNYEANIQVLTFPVEELCSENGEAGENSLEFLLGKGWYMGEFGLDGQKENYGDRMAVIAELHLEYEDGTTACICTDQNWKYCGSDIEDSGIYFGEDLNRLLWEEKENPWKPVEVIADSKVEEGTKNLAKSHLMDRLSLPVVAKEQISVKEILHTPVGETVLDMGQNFAGFVEFDADLPKGTKVVLDFGEILQNDNFYRENYREARSQFVYISGGKPETVRPHFTFFGFRYVRVTGWAGELKKEAFRGNVLYSDLQRTGYIHTNHEKINRLYENTVWGLKSNFLDMPTDCPQRNERLGWTGDAQVFAPTASYHMDTRAFFHKFVKDLRDEQKMIDGAVPNYVPNIGHKEDAGSVWGDIATFLPYTLYIYFGNQEEMNYCYPLMKDWVDYIDRKDGERGEKHYLFDFGFHFGDWLALDGATPTSFKGSTEDTYIASVYYCESVRKTAEIAETLGLTEDAAHYRKLEEKIRQAVLAEYFTPNGRLAVTTQAAYVIALKFGIYVDREYLIAQFKKKLQADGNQIKCGFVGAPLLCTVLAEAGLYELAYDFLLKEGFPSWLYSVNLGATTIWERWNSVLPDGTISPTGMNSLNHYSYGSVMEFMYAYAAGIRPAEPGFARAVIAPHPDVRLPKMECSYDSVNGKYTCNFEICPDGTLHVVVEIPFNCEAEVELPGYKEGKQILSAGRYEFDYVPETDYCHPYGEKTTLARVGKDPKALAVLGKYTPALAGMSQSDDAEFLYNTLEEISYLGFLPFDPEKLQQAIKELKEINVLEA